MMRPSQLAAWSLQTLARIYRGVIRKFERWLRWFADTRIEFTAICVIDGGKSE
jgi:hypothetical protein